jgi:uncharacterized UPF0160 family protein
MTSVPSERAVPSAVTHDGPFHADDVLATAMLRRLHPGLRVERTRDPARIAAADIAFDVGGRYDHAAGRYDHHMPDRALRPDGIPYAACGLVWRHHGAGIVARLFPDAADAAHRDAVAEALDGGLVRCVDAVDNGAAVPAASDFAGLVDALSPAPGEEGSADLLFDEAVRIADLFLFRSALRTLAGLRAVDAFAEAAAAAPDPRVVVLDRYMPWSRAARKLDLPELLYVVHPNGQGTEWLCAAVRDPDGGEYDLRRPLPESWAGLRDGAFSAEAGIPDGVFCHPARFLCGARSRASACELARIAAGARGEG